MWLATRKPRIMVHINFEQMLSDSIISTGSQLGIHIKVTIVSLRYQVHAVSCSKWPNNDI